MVDADTVQHIIVAVEISLDNATPTDARRLYESQLLAFWDSNESIPYIPVLVGCSSAKARHYGLMVLERMVSQRWLLFDETERQNLRELAMHILQSGTQSLTSEQSFIKQKLADVFVALWRVEWPQGCPSLFDVLIAAGAAGDTQAELVLMFFASASEIVNMLSPFATRVKNGEIASSLDLPPERRKELIEAFQGSVEILFPFLASCLQRFAAQLGSEEGALFLLKAALNAVVSLLEWAPLTSMPDLPIVPMLPHFLRNPDLRKLACQAMAALLRRQFVKANTPAIALLFDEIPVMFEALNTDNIEFATDLVGPIVGLGLFQLTAYRRNSYSPETAIPIHPNFAVLVENMLSVTKHDSIPIQLDAIQFWLSFLRTDTMMSGQGELESAVMHGLLEWVAATLSAPPRNNPVDVRQYDTEEDLARGVKELRGGAEKVMRALTRLNSHVTIAFAVEYQRHVWGLLAAAAEDVSGAASAKESDAYRCLHALGVVVEACLKSMPPQCIVSPDESMLAQMSAEQREAEAQLEPQREKTRASAEEALAATVAFDTHAVHLADRFLVLLDSFAQLAMMAPDQIGTVFTKVVGYVAFRQPHEELLPPSALSAETWVTRLQACTTLFTLTLHIGNTLVPVLGQLWQRVQELDEAGELRDPERMLLYKCVLVIAAESEEVAVQQGLIGSLLGPIVEAWTSPSFTATVANAQEFCAAAGLLAGIPHSDGTISFRRNVHRLVSVLRIVFKWSTGWKANVLGTHIASFLYPLLTLMRTMHTLSSPFVQEQIFPQYRSAFGIPPEGLDKKGVELFERDPTMLSESDQVTAMQWWVDDVVDACYGTLGAVMAFKDFFGHADVLPAMSAAIFTELEHLNLNTMMSLLIKVINALLRHCPATHTEVLAAIMPAWVAASHTRLEAEWQAYERAQAGEQQGTLEQEVALHNVLQDLTLNHARYLRSMSFKLPPQPHAAIVVDEVSPVGMMLISPPMDRIFVTAVIGVLRWPLSSAAYVAVNLAEKILPFFSHQPDFQQVFAKDMFPAVLGALSRSDEDLETDKHLDVVGELYCLLTPIFPDVMRGTMGAIPGISATDLHNLERTLAEDPPKKLRRDLLRGLLASVVSANVPAAQYKRDGAG